jgi:hypothetical protein
MSLLVAVEAPRFAIAGAVRLVVGFAWAKDVVVFGLVAFAALVAFDCIARHGASVGDVAEFVAAAALCERGSGDPLAEGDWFAKHG